MAQVSEDHLIELYNLYIDALNNFISGMNRCVVTPETTKIVDRFGETNIEIALAFQNTDTQKGGK